MRITISRTLYTARVNPQPDIDLGTYVGMPARDALSFYDGGPPEMEYPPFRIPSGSFAGHVVIAGQSGAGKTETLLRIMWEVASKWQWQVIVIDAKPDPSLATALKGMAQKLERNFTAFPDSGYDVWRGDPMDVATRLVELTTTLDPTRLRSLNLTRRAIAAAPAKAESFELFLNNWNWLIAGQLQEPQLSAAKELAEQYRSFHDTYPAVLDGERAVEDTDIAYYGLDAMKYPDVAEALATIYLRDIAAYVARRHRKRTHANILVVFDEFSAVPVQVATDLVERIRSLGVQVLLGVQSFAGLGNDRDRLLDASNLLLLHRSARPESFVPDTIVDPLVIRRLPAGQLVAVALGRAARIAVQKWTPADPG